jgi:hypothetical protein
MEEKYDSYIEESYRALDSPICMIPFIIHRHFCQLLRDCSDDGVAALGVECNSFLELPWVRQCHHRLCGQVFEPLESIGMEIQNIQSAVAGVKRINEFLSERERTVPEGPQTGRFPTQTGNQLLALTMWNWI